MKKECITNKLSKVFSKFHKLLTNSFLVYRYQTFCTGRKNSHHSGPIFSSFNLARIFLAITATVKLRAARNCGPECERRRRQAETVTLRVMGDKGINFLHGQRLLFRLKIFTRYFFFNCTKEGGNDSRSFSGMSSHSREASRMGKMRGLGKLGVV